MSQRALARIWLAPVLLLPAILLAACSAPREEPLLRQFFRAAQLADSQTLASLALATLNPKTEGAVTSFEIVSVSPERVEPRWSEKPADVRVAVAERSLVGTASADLGRADSQLISKDVSLHATMRMPDGSTTEKPLVVTMQRARLKTGSSEQLGRWIITSIGPA